MRHVETGLNRTLRRVRELREITHGVAFAIVRVRGREALKRNVTDMVNGFEIPPNLKLRQIRKVLQEK